MRNSSLLLLVACLAVSSPLLVRADSLDPGMTIDSGDPPPPTDLSVGVDFTPDDTLSSQAFDYFNDLTGVVTSFTLTTFVAPNYNTSLLSCNPGDYFLHCSISYVTETVNNKLEGALTYSFFGTNPLDGDEKCSMFDPTCESGEKEGIPIDGLFHFELTGWTDQTGLYTANNPPVDVHGTFTLSPEPSMFEVTGAALLLLFGVVSLRRRKAATARVR
jgi:hypothetical protein